MVGYSLTNTYAPVKSIQSDLIKKWIIQIKNELIVWTN